MISALIPAHNSEQLLVLTLSALVPASAEGILKEVIIADEGSTDGTSVVADACGAHFVTNAANSGSVLTEGAQQCTRANWILLIQPGAILQVGWQAEAAAFIERAERTNSASNLIGVYRSRTEEFGPSAQIKERLANAKNRLLKSSCYQLPLLMQKQHLQQALLSAPNANRRQQLKKVLSASRIHWLNGTVVFQNPMR
ncbi:hypothetical protein GCM10007094_07150 [Pseudovibrio japonicus]|uniref:Glycosyltransferase 2-like domain-containing protein n=1 Tax=Pseudovibrio japonicus TaxID=366534 RepID=A0ABQ3E3X6_9HYPH|nr:glycosyltransferase [Pseudovibrio japonicus]GHB21632.1 hypothetical protein GCM10007094_07150 [Pseudovibrio japonicus]